MKNNQKGITLIALVITIVILLILAGISISGLSDNGLFGKAQDAKSDYQAAQENEEAILGDYLQKLERLEIKVGDKIEYDEGTGKTSTIDTAFVMDDMEWRILDVEPDGTVELISTQPTTSTFTIPGEDGWLNAESNLDTLCNDLYANGEGVTARGLKVEDIDKLAGVITEQDKKACKSSYGSLWRYMYNDTTKKIQYSTSTDEGITWTGYTDAKDAKFKAPGEVEINSSNYLDSDGNPIIKEVEYTNYSYTISEKITNKTSDDISIAELITQGLNDSNDATSGENITQWLSSRSTAGSNVRAFWNVRWIASGRVTTCDIWHSNSGKTENDRKIRPVVTIPATATLTKVDGVWKVELTK